MKKILKSRRGIAIEGAIMVMALMLVISILLSAIVMSAHSNARLSENLFERRLAIEQIGEYFLAGHSEEDELIISLRDKYNLSVEINGDTLIITRSGTTVLYVEKSGNTASVWRYSDLESSN